MNINMSIGMKNIINNKHQQEKVFHFSMPVFVSVVMTKHVSVSMSIMMVQMHGIRMGKGGISDMISGGCK